MTDNPPTRDILELACRAPSVHNTQPWRWRVQGPGVLAAYATVLLLLGSWGLRRWILRG